ncbi:putative tRNA dimethylallyltransferase, mitochondrial [Hypsibius exemplaris]|uniref:tRNA dimethylallyltransferase, mitochondrial n=1 Tax=Hypsibius exemplaris TaxID=2072580 RepID=A0A1W0WP02_HYPEX|nr:putative tRNA dimethylallyltransferase, mitochondrial [Hypsibius exemplaris]
MQTLPVVVVLGATGTGKSKLAIALARHFNGEIINADSMQGLDIVTNKVTADEQSGVRIMLGVVDPLKRFSVVDFRNRCLPIIDSLRSRQKLPVLVGGTHYYIESVCGMSSWNNQTRETRMHWFWMISWKTWSPVLPTKMFSHHLKTTRKNMIAGYSRTALLNPEVNFADTPSAKLHKLLKIVDPAAADELHPGSLQVYAQHRQTHSELLAANVPRVAEARWADRCGTRTLLLFWLQCDETVLEKRLDARVDQMIEAGLVRELLHFHEQLAGRSLPYTQGISSRSALKSYTTISCCPRKSDTPEHAQLLLQTGIDEIKRRTKHYAEAEPVD